MSDSTLQGHIVVVDDDRSLSKLIAHWLRRANYEVHEFHDGESCLAGLQRILPDAICLDINMPGLGGIETLRLIKERHRHLPVLILTADTQVDTVVSAMQLGAYDYLPKPLDENKLVTTVRNAVERYRLAVRLETLEREASADGYPGILGKSAAMKGLFREIDRVAGSDVTVLIHGESGTGKELVARALHDHSGRREGGFVALNCAAIPETLQETELFGHEKGAFTGATERRVGRFEQADGGTLFLDEVAELSLGLQAKLLRAVQERRFHRVGGSNEVRSDFRLLAASNRDLATEAQEGRFREDLFYRIAVFELEVPPLRARDGDVLFLSTHFLSLFSEGTPPRFSPESQALVESYNWPGNVREMENAMRRACVLAQDGVILPSHLPPRVRRAQGETHDETPFTPSLPISHGATPPAPTSPTSPPNGGTLPVVTLAQLERQAITEALLRTDGNVSLVGRQLGIGRTSLYRKMAKYNLR